MILTLLSLMVKHSSSGISDENREFVNFLFDKLVSHVDMAMLDLHESDSCDDHLQLELLCD
jgi:hypothetical protein